jgi:hypothetical protein
MLPAGVLAALQRVPFRKSGLDRMKKGSAFTKKNPMLVILDYIVIQFVLLAHIIKSDIRREEVDRIGAVTRD